MFCRLKTMHTKRREKEWVVLISTSTLWKRRGYIRHIPQKRTVTPTEQHTEPERVDVSDTS